MDFLNLIVDDVLSDRQHGFRARRNCESQLLSLTQELHEHLENKSHIDLIVLNFSKAFDKVPHLRLMGKIWNQGINIINSSASSPHNAKTIAVKKVSFVFVSMFRFRFRSSSLAI